MTGKLWRRGRSAQCCPDFRVRDPVRACGRVRRYRIPHMPRPELREIRLPKGRGVQIYDHSPRTQARSPSVVPAGIVAGGPEPGTGCPLPERIQGWARNRATASISGAGAPGCGPTSRATGSPREVTTISSPARVRRRYSDRWSLRSRMDTSMVRSPRIWPLSVDHRHCRRNARGSSAPNSGRVRLGNSKSVRPDSLLTRNVSRWWYKQGVRQ